MKITNKEVAALFYELGKLMELHGESPFKTKAYDNAYRVIRGLAEDVIDLSQDELTAIPGIGKAISEKILSLQTTDSIPTLEKYRDMTPEGVRDMLGIKGLGPKKVKQLWVELGIESVGELLYACHENRLVELKGFGIKTQEEVASKAQYFLDNRGYYHYATLYTVAEKLLETIQQQFPEHWSVLTGEIRSKTNIVQYIDILSTAKQESLKSLLDMESDNVMQADYLTGTYLGYPVRLFYTKEAEKGTNWWTTTVQAEFTSFYFGVLEKELPSTRKEIDLFTFFNKPEVIPERREVELIQYDKVLTSKEIIQLSDIKGVVHLHTTYSDGAEDLKTMADTCREHGFEWMLVTDHSQTAVYAQGLKENELRKQWAEIDQLNSQYSDFKIFKGIESDILSDGSLDYPEEILKQFDCIIASIHSGFRMDEEKATTRLIKAIQNPYTKILGHPTGRLLLSRRGYPVDHKKLIDAAAANNVAIEINSNPYRLDLDWTWIPYALDKGVKLSINPDAHSLRGIMDIQWGIAPALKGGASARDLICCLNQNDFQSFIDS